MQTDHPASNDPRKPVLAVRLPGGGLSTRTGIVMSRFLLSTSTLAAALLTSNTAFAQSDGQNQAPTPRATDIIVIGMPNTDQATAELARTPGAVEVIRDPAFQTTTVQHHKALTRFPPGVY